MNLESDYIGKSIDTVINDIVFSLNEILTKDYNIVSSVKIQKESTPYCFSPIYNIVIDDKKSGFRLPVDLIEDMMFSSLYSSLINEITVALAKDISNQYNTK